MEEFAKFEQAWRDRFPSFVTEEFKRDPYLRSLRHLTGKIRKPEQAIGTQRAHALRLGEGLKDPSAAQYAFSRIYMADPYLWRDELVVQLWNGSSLPPHQIDPVLFLPRLPAWFGFDYPIGMSQGTRIYGIIIDRMDKDTGKLLTGLVLEREDGSTSFGTASFFPRRWPDDVRTEAEAKVEVADLTSYMETIKKTLILAHFLNGSCVSQDPKVAPRHIRKKAKRRSSNPPPVKFVWLRKRESGVSVGEASREYNFQWMVSGHFRRQWCPSRGSHKLIWIEPYVKGPADKPLKPKPISVGKVVR